MTLSFVTLFNFLVNGETATGELASLILRYRQWIASNL
jgi:hypothetical protein